MAGMTGASSNIGCLETLPVARCWTECPRSTRLGSVRLYTRGCIVYSVYSGVIQEPIYNSKYNGAIYSGVYKGAVSRASSIFCCFTQWATSLSLSWHMSLRLHFIYQRKREAPALSTFSPPTTTKMAFPLKHWPLGDVLYQGLGQAINPDQQPQLGSLYPHFSFNIRRPRPGWSLQYRIWIVDKSSLTLF